MSDENPVEEKPKDIVVPVTKTGDLEFHDHIGVAQAASIVMRTRLAPPSLIKEGKEAVMAALLACKQFNLPQKSMNQMAFIKDRITFYGYLVQGIAERHPEYGEKREYFLDENQDIICVQNKNLQMPAWAAIVEIRKKGSTIWNQYFFTADDAEKANLYKNSVWKSYPRDMLMHKARKRALSAEYASVLEGVDYHEDVREAIDIMPVRASQENADALNNMMEVEDDTEDLSEQTD